MKIPEEKRYYPRKSVPCSVTVDTGKDRGAGELQNLSVQGLCFTCDLCLPVGSRVSVVLDPRPHLRKAELIAKILRCEPLKSRSTPGYIVAATIVSAHDEYLMDALALVHGREVRP